MRPSDVPADLDQSALDRASLATRPRTLVEVFRDTVARHPEASAFDDGAGALSYGELAALVSRTAARLHEAGVRRGDRIGIRVPSGSRDLYVSILGVLAAGAAYVPVDADDTDERAALVFGEAAVTGIIGTGGVYVPTDPASGGGAATGPAKGDRGGGPVGARPPRPAAWRRDPDRDGAPR